MQHSFLDRYYQGTSLVHRLDPRLKLLATLAYVLAVTSTPPPARGSLLAWRWLAFLLLAGLAFGAIWLARIPLVVALRRSAIALPFAGMAALSLPFTRSGEAIWTWSLWGWDLAVTDAGLLLFVSVLAKAWLSVMASGLLVATTRFPDLLQALRSLRVPVALTVTISFMLRYLFVLVEEAMRLQIAREARSAGPGRSAVWRAQVLGKMIGSLFIRSYERSERIYAAMLARGFAGEVRALTGLAWQGRDTWAAAAWGLALAGVVFLPRTMIR